MLVYPAARQPSIVSAVPLISTLQIILLVTERAMTRSRVVDVESFPMVHPLIAPYGCSKFLTSERAGTLIRITTSDGVHGWGECLGSPRLTAPVIEQCAQTLLNRSIHDVQNPLLNVLSRSYHLTTGGLHMYALSGLDIALWDARARSFGVSVADLLGGRVRNRIRAYASTGYVTNSASLDEFEHQLRCAVEEGFTAAKIRIGTGRDEDRRRTELARDILGPNRDLMVDYNANGTWDTASRSIEAIRDLDITWYEEPLPPDDQVGWARLRTLGIVLSGGESLSSRYGFRDAITAQRFDVHQPDLAGCGGLTEGLAITHLITAFNGRISPHCWGGVVLQAATVQLLAALPEAPFGGFGPDPTIFEYDRGRNPQRDLAGPAAFALRDGHVLVPDAPGLGVDLDVEAVRASSISDSAVHVWA
ncbi:mandelate racemase/muconate lactonizing enzyme family protein [Mycolicibacterium boenickei]